MMRKLAAFSFVVCLSVFAAACGGDDSSDDDSADGGTDDTADDSAADDTNPSDDSDDSGDDTGDDDTAGTYWEPSTVVPIEAWPEARGMMVQRGIIHLHCTYSHDGCDSMPFIDGHPNWKCMDDLRAAICDTNQQYIMATDHDSPFSDYEFPEVLYYLEDEGDELIYDGADPIANIIHCADGNDALLMAGNENDLMPVHLRRMPDGTPDERRALLGGHTQADVDGMHALGAQVFVNHSEQWTTEEIASLTVDGIELFNLHAAILPEDTIDIISMVVNVLQFMFPREGSGDSDLVLLAFLNENTTNIEHFDKLLDMRHTVGVMATDAHRNSLPFPLWDGDRADSYRRMMRWFANYVLVDDMDVENIEDALARGRMFGAFQVFGEPVGFDFYAETGKGSTEMGDEVALAASPVLHVGMPELYNMDPTLDVPEITVRIIKAGAAGGTVVDESAEGPLAYTVDDAGVYRAEARIVPHHLRWWLGDNADMFIREYPLVYSNAIYVTD